MDGYFFIAMQYIEGRTVAEILKQEKRIEPQRAAKFTIEILSQLDKLHSFSTEIEGQRRSVVHGDIKPSNIQIGADDEVRLLDFGIAKALTFTHSRTHLNLGSPSYCSPERLSRGEWIAAAELTAGVGDIGDADVAVARFAESESAEADPVSLGALGAFGDAAHTLLLIHVRIHA